MIMIATTMLRCTMFEGVGDLGFWGCGGGFEVDGWRMGGTSSRKAKRVYGMFRFV